MSEKLTQYFRMISNYRREKDLLRRKIILEQGLPGLARTCSSDKLRQAIARFIKENAGGDQGSKQTG